jgi:small subunit ribosomal protein S8
VTSVFAVFVSENLLLAEKFRVLKNQAGNMFSHDPIGDMMTRIRNAQAVGHPTVIVPFSRLKQEIAAVLKREGFIEGFEKKGRGAVKRLEIKLSYTDTLPKITGYRRRSKLGQREYSGHATLYPIRGGYGIAVLSTPKGVLSDKEAKAQHVGGEIFFEVW